MLDAVDPLHAVAHRSDGVDASWTAREIAQQPSVWRKVIDQVDAARADLQDWLAPILAKPALRIVLTGAGSSAYIGEALAPVLRARLGRWVDAVSTTDIVGHPRATLTPVVPTLLISFARSGNSPESAAAVRLAEQLIPDCHHLAVACAPESALVEALSEAASACTILLPPETLDRSFAMTSSFTSMLLATLWLFAPDDRQAAVAIAFAEAMIRQGGDDVRPLLDAGARRFAFLGSGTLFGFAREAALKMLELTAGQVDAYAETPLGFRHGPKSIVSSDTVTILLGSLDGHSRRYDEDLTAELAGDGVAAVNLRLDQTAAARGQGKALARLDDVWLGLGYMVFCQLLALQSAHRRGISPDNPSPSGLVNRVVQGVTIHPLNPPA